MENLPELATGGGVVALTVFLTWAVRQLAAVWLAEAAITRATPAAVILVAFAVTYATAATPLPLQAGIGAALTAAAASMAAWSGTKALLGK